MPAPRSDEHARVVLLTPGEIRAWRIRAGLSQRQLAIALGVHLNNIGRWEAGTQQPVPYLSLALETLSHHVDDGYDERGHDWNSLRLTADQRDVLEAYRVRLNLPDADAAMAHLLEQVADWLQHPA